MSGFMKTEFKTDDQVFFLFVIADFFYLMFLLFAFFMTAACFSYLA